MSVDQKGDACPSPSGKNSRTTPRMPKPETEARLLRDGGPPASDVAKTTLSVDAPVFVPKNYSPEPTQPAVLLSASAPVFVPRGGYPDFVTLHSSPHQKQDCIAQEFEEMSVRDDTQNDSFLVYEFTRTVNILLTNPGNLTEYLCPLCDKLRTAETDDVLHEVINILYEQCIMEPNFRYTGARVCHYLTNHLKDHAIFCKFRTLFLKRCQADFSKRGELLMRGEDELQRLCGLTLFMGELFLNYTADTDSKSEKIEFLPKVLTELVKTLLSQPMDVTVKTVCQLLKLAGGPTEDMVKASPSLAKDFNDVFTTLSHLQTASCISQNMKFLVKSVLNLRQSNWGRADPVSPSSVEAHSNRLNAVPVNFTQSEPVFYDLSGKPISREEAGYREEEEEEEEDPDNQYILNEEEEQEFLAWQAEVRNCVPEHNPYPPQIQLQGSRPSQDICINDLSYQEPCVYTSWSTSDTSYQENYSYNDYAASGYPAYSADNILAMSEEEEAAYEEFLSQSYHQLNPMGKR